MLLRPAMDRRWRLSPLVAVLLLAAAAQQAAAAGAVVVIPSALSRCVKPQGYTGAMVLPVVRSPQMTNAIRSRLRSAGWTAGPSACSAARTWTPADRGRPTPPPPTPNGRVRPASTAFHNAAQTLV